MLERSLAGAMLAFGLGAGAAMGQPLCPDTASLTVFADNRSAAPAVTVDVEGELAGDAVTCLGAGAAAYQETFTCEGPGLVRCGVVTGLAPGAWVHRFATQVPDSAPQAQAQRGVLVAGVPADVSNALVWTVYPKTVVVGGPGPADLAVALAEAEAFTAAGGEAALVTFAPAVFPGAASPRRVFLIERPCVLDDARNVCRPGGVPDGATAGLCFTGSRIVVDALDRDARPGGVVLSVDTCGREGVRLYGSDNVLRGLVLEGSRRPDPVPPCQLDTLAIVGAAARRNRIEQSVVLGPTCGDAVSVQHDAGRADGPGAADNVVVASRITGAADKGLKASFGGVVRIEDSCVHDNANGGIQSTLGGQIHAARNVVQHNVPGAAQNGLSAGSVTAARSLLTTEGNVVRFAGSRGLSVTGNADAVFAHDYVADNQFAGSRVDATADVPAEAAPPSARFTGVAFVCNRNANLTGTCSPPPASGSGFCTTAEDCCTAADGTVDPACVAVTTCGPSGPPPVGVGAITTRAAGRPDPVVHWGDAASPGRNAFTANASTAEGANFRVLDVDGPVTAQGNQWERCGPGVACDVASVLADDVVSSGAVVDVGTPAGPRAGVPLLTRVQPARPHAGDIVRIFGDHFDAIEGNHLPTDACAALPLCGVGEVCPTGPCVAGACPCAIDSPPVRERNETTGANRIRLRSGDGTLLATLHPDAVTPTMLAFRMPFDCFAPLELEVTKRGPDGADVAATTALCDPGGCLDAVDGMPCDDGDACTTDDRCLAGACAPGAPLACAGQCWTGACDPASGCVPRAAGAACDDGDACTAPDGCSGTGDTCVAGLPVACAGPCLTGACVPATGCVPAPASTPCDDGSACTAADHCSGVGPGCAGEVVPCDAPCETGACEPATGCTPATGVEALTCRVDECPEGRLGRKLRRLRERIERTLERGGTPGRRRVRRLERLLGRCGITLPDAPP